MQRGIYKIFILPVKTELSILNAFFFFGIRTASGLDEHKNLNIWTLKTWTELLQTD